jgi:uncharacterized RDD family membrane protein YckC
VRPVSLADVPVSEAPAAAPPASERSEGGNGGESTPPPAAASSSTGAAAACAASSDARPAEVAAASAAEASIEVMEVERPPSPALALPEPKMVLRLYTAAMDLLLILGLAAVVYKEARPLVVQYGGWSPTDGAMSDRPPIDDWPRQMLALYLYLTAQFCFWPLYLAFGLSRKEAKRVSLARAMCTMCLVRMKDGATASFWHAFGREVVKWGLFGFVPLLAVAATPRPHNWYFAGMPAALDLVTAILRDDGRALHDLITGTRIVKRTATEGTSDGR